MPTFEAWVWSRQEQRKIRRSFPNLAAAKSWRADASKPAREGTLRAPSKVTLRQGSGASTIRNTIVPLQAIFRRALSRNGITVNPALGLELPAVTGRRERMPDPAEAERLLEALPDADRPLWATAMYAGLRRGELLALDGATSTSPSA